MKENVITIKKMECFRTYLIREERSRNTVTKYMRDLKKFLIFCNEKTINKKIVIDYKEYLQAKHYKPESINSMLAALNCFFRYIKREDLRVKFIKVQKQTFSPEEKELTKAEYIRLCQTAEKKGNIRLSLLIQTICSTGIRVSELSYITAEGVKTGQVSVSLKGKNRIVFLPEALRVQLLSWMQLKNLNEGPVFVSRNGKPLSRTNIWREMKRLCAEAGVNPEKVFPHNLRHLFARVFYDMDKDIAKLADILGHSNIETTRIYIVSSGTEHWKLLENMGLVMKEKKEAT